jgi:N-acetylmuramoyl-L-alanine amidase
MKKRKSTTKIIIHCTATKETQDITTDTIRRWHVVERGWSDIGYHYVVRLDGTVEKGRSEELQGAHTKGQNSSSIGVAYVGGCDDNLNPKDTRNKAQKEALKILVNDLMIKYPGSIVYGHNDFSDKACPCFNAFEEYKINGQYIKAIRNN